MSRTQSAPSIRYPSPRCSPYFFSNDNWRRETVGDLHAALDKQSVHPNQCAGMVIGSGGLPYILSHVAVAHMYVADVDNGVIQTTIERTNALRDFDDWETYAKWVYREQGDYFGYLFLQEYSRAIRSRLLGDYVVTQMGVIATELHPLPGDIRQTVPSLAAELRERQLSATFINVTSAANQLHGILGSIFLGRRQRMAAMGEVIEQLPLSRDTIIIDSSNWRLHPELYTPDTYPGVLSPGNTAE